MKLTVKIFAAALALAVASGCSKKNDVQIDKEYPVIDISAANAFPKQCSVIKRGESFTFIANVTDNAELGTLGVDVHHNFDHHSHSTEVTECVLSPKKTPVKPFLLVQSYTIPSGLRTYKVNQTINVPADIDPGDYHFLIRLVDKEGWQTIKGISIKIQ
ncbi:DUF4625 domain-containing protein [Mucilaginibacter roseus]|uniref:DUF4625 domain-containing protein n=1 Tax=Mucilaginibacter roseus TaxID=1528868 RepID=A0ABS8TZQ0_9SPHI|nr:DUF4625 domain-containing protein [Mucilaginibacter roseus]MCD8739293.1 DUF4625 domain-containing protein [Mucilaginibacter roseus]